MSISIHINCVDTPVSKTNSLLLTVSASTIEETISRLVPGQVVKLLDNHGHLGSKEIQREQCGISVRRCEGAQCCFEVRLLSDHRTQDPPAWRGSTNSENGSTQKLVITPTFDGARCEPGIVIEVGGIHFTLPSTSSSAKPAMKVAFIEDEECRALVHPQSKVVQAKGMAKFGDPVFFHAEHALGSVAAVTGFGHRPPRAGTKFLKPSQDAFIVKELPDGSLQFGVIDGHYDYGHIAALLLLHRLDVGWENGESSYDILAASNAALAQLVYNSGVSTFYQNLEDGQRFLGIGACSTTARLSPNSELVSEHVGDTRTTVIRREGEHFKILYESWDHNVAGDDQRKGGPAKMYSSKEYSQLTRGIAPTTEESQSHLPERGPVQQLQPGDWIVLTSDGGRVLGTSAWLTEKALGGGVKSFISGVHEALERNRLERGYADDYTVVAIEVR